MGNFAAKFFAGVILFIGFVALITGIGALSAWFLAAIVNYVFAPAVVAAVFGGVLTFWKAWGLMVVISLLGFRPSSK